MPYVCTRCWVACPNEASPMRRGNLSSLPRWGPSLWVWANWSLVACYTRKDPQALLIDRLLEQNRFALCNKLSGYHQVSHIATYKASLNEKYQGGTAPDKPSLCPFQEALRCNESGAWKWSSEWWNSDFSPKRMKMFSALLFHHQTSSMNHHLRETHEKHTNIILKSTILCYLHNASL